MEDGLPAVGPMTETWVDFFIMAGVFVMIATGALIWVFYFRKRGRKRRHKHRHHREPRPVNPTLAQTGGLPPARPSEPSGPTPSQTP
jgi:hypothetical protein